MKEFQEILAAVLWRMSCENILACFTPAKFYHFVSCLYRFTNTSAAFLYLAKFVIALRVIDACSKTCNARIVQEIDRASKLHGINFERNTVPLSKVVVANRSM